MNSLPRINLGKRTRADDVADHLLELIEKGEFPEGSQLPAEQELAVRFSVGRPAVRQALFILQQQGLVQVTSGTRARVAAPSANMLNDQVSVLIKRVTSSSDGQLNMEQVRLLFEASVAWQATLSASDEDIAEFKRLLDSNVAAADRIPEFIRTDLAFHRHLSAMTRNPLLINMYDILLEWLVDQRTNTINLPHAPQLSVRDHTNIYEAVAAREPMRAYHAMTTHLRVISELYRESRLIKDDVYKKLVQDVADRVDREMKAVWKGGNPLFQQENKKKV